LGFALGLEKAVAVMVWVIGGLTVLSAATYLVNWLAHMASYEKPRRTVHRPARHKRRKTQVRRNKEPVTGS
jgi:hypothetical protein